jgi:hypothetical protein
MDERYRLVREEYVKAIKLTLTYIKFSQVVGAVGEFGCHGKLSIDIASYLAKYDPDRAFHIFDSFAGYPDICDEVDKKAPHVLTNAWTRARSISSVSANMLKNKVSKIHPPSHIHAGFFAETLPDTNICEGFAVMIMDCALYRSHFDVLYFIFSHHLLSFGGIIMFSDYNSNLASPECSSRRAWCEIVKLFNVKYDDEGSYNWGGRKFVVHSYDGLSS